MSKKKDNLTMIDLDDTESSTGLIPQQITLKDDEFDRFIQNIQLSKSASSKVQDLVFLALCNLDKPPKFYELGDNGIFKEKEQQFKYNFKECIENADKGYLVSFFVEEVTLLSQKTALSEGLSVESPYVLLRNGKRIPISDADDLERKVSWIEYFKTYHDSKGLEEFLADREQDIPREIDL